MGALLSLTVDGVVLTIDYSTLLSPKAVFASSNILFAKEIIFSCCAFFVINMAFLVHSHLISLNCL